MARPAAQNQGAHLEAAVLRVLRSGRYIGGPEVAAFEKALAAYVGADHAVGTASGTAALHAVLLALGVGAGDEVVLPAYTFCATLEAVLHVGATPVLVDIDADHLLDVDAVAAATTARTRAVVAVHLFGRRASVPALRARVPAHVAIIEDSAQAFGPHRPEGCAACFSFFPAKVLGAAGDAGAVVTADGALGARVRAIVNPGREAGVSQTLG
ncbi:MAG: aminotransferase class I/II-fold pyridoxal phosphate-dependent enzyme, partial [Myxococcota bacterium]